MIVIHNNDILGLQNMFFQHLFSQTCEGFCLNLFILFLLAHTRHRASVLVVFVVFCMHMHSFAGLIRRTPSPTFSDTAITDCHSDTTIFQLRAHWVRISWSIGSEKT